MIKKLFMEAATRITARNVLAWCAAITAFFLIFRTGFGPKSADVMLVVLGILVLAGRESRTFLGAIWPRMRIYFYCFAAIIFFVVLAQLITYFRSGANQLEPETLGLYGRVLFDAYAFLLAAFLIAFDRRLLRWVSFAIFISPLVMVPIYWQQDSNWYLSGSRLAGFLKNPIVLGIWMMIIFLIGMGYFLSIKTWWKKAFIALWLVVIANFVFWSSTRSVWLALPLSLLVWALLEFHKNNLARAAYLMLIPFFAFSAGFMILKFLKTNLHTQAFIADRAIMLITNPLAGQKNTHDWSRGIPLSAQYPLGLGLPTPSETESRPTTDTFLEVFLYGGVGALAAFLIILGKLGNGIKNALARTKEVADDHLAHAWFIAAPAIVLTMFFTDSFFFRLAWIALGITLGITWTLQTDNVYNKKSKIGFMKKFLKALRVRIVAIVWKTGVELFRGKGLQSVWPFGRIYDWMVSVFENYDWPDAVNVHGYKIYTTPMHKASLALWGGKGDEPAFRLFEREIPKGGTVIDVGANVGHYALHLTHAAGENGKVFSFEPGPESIKFLKKNLAANNCHNVTVVEKAVGDRSGRVELFLAHESGGNQIFDVRKIISDMPDPSTHQRALLENRKKNKDYERSTSVDLVSLDDFFKDYAKPIDFVKIDVEGAEDEVLAGMKNVLRKNPGIKLFFEFTPTFLTIQGKDPKKMLEALQESGFVFYNMHDAKNHEHLADRASIGQLIAACKGNTAIDIFAKKA